MNNFTKSNDPLVIMSLGKVEAIKRYMQSHLYRPINDYKITNDWVVIFPKRYDEGFYTRTWLFYFDKFDHVEELKQYTVDMNFFDGFSLREYILKENS